MSSESRTPAAAASLDSNTTDDNNITGLRALVRSTRGQTMEASLSTYLTFLGRKDDEHIFMQVIDPRHELRSSATAVAANIATALDLLRLAEMFEAQGDYLVPNRVKKGVEARYPLGTWVPDRKGEGISDKDIAARRAVYIDGDAVRDAGDGPVRGISASTKEASMSIGVVLDVADLYGSILGDEDALGFGMSGNGGHLHIATEDLDPEASEPLVKDLLSVTAALFDTKEVKIDTSVTDAKRIAPAFGTTKRKANSTKERPWRRTWFVAPAVAGGRPVRRLTIQDLKMLVAELRRKLTPEQVVALEAASKPKAGSSPRPTTIPKIGADLFKQANAIPYADVMSRLGMALACPGCGETNDSGLYEPGNRWHCFRATCQPSSPKGSGNWSGIDAVAKARDVKPKEAAKLICEAFGFEIRGPGRPRKQLSLDDLQRRVEAAGLRVANEDRGEGEADDLPDSSIGAEAEAPKAHALTDLGNAERLIAKHGDDLRYVGRWNHWIVWDGTRWQKDHLGLVRRRAHDTVRAIIAEGLCAGSDEERARIATWATQSESSGRIEAMVNVAEGRISVVPEQLNRSALRLNCANGTVDLETGTLHPHERGDLLTTVTRVPFVAYNPFDAKAWEGFLRRVQPDAEVRSFLQRLVGASVLGEVREHILPVHNGKGRNGKGTFFETILHVLGDYGVAVPEELLVEGSGDHPTLLATLYGKRLAVASETEQGDVLAISRLKRLTGGDTISCRRMREDWWDYEPTHLIHLQTNHRPRVLDTGLAAWERLLLITWGVTIPKEQRDKTLKKKLLAEASHILGWIVEGARAYLKDGLNVPASIERATAEWKAEEDLVGQFLAEKCLTWERHGKDRRAEGRFVDEDWYTVGKRELFAAYVEWAEGSGSKPKGLLNFRKELIDRGFVEEREPGTGSRQWDGIGLRDAVEAKVAELEVENVLEAV